MSSKFILSKLKQSRYCIILIVSSDASINVSQGSMFRNCKNYNSEVATHTIVCNNITINICDDLHCVLFALLINDVELCLPHWSLADLVKMYV